MRRRDEYRGSLTHDRWYLLRRRPGFCKQKAYNPKLGMDSLVVTPISVKPRRSRDLGGLAGLVLGSAIACTRKRLSGRKCSLCRYRKSNGRTWGM